jgi:UDP-N-acetylmuramoyl-tripeptide--D-alanyl-D-alanine ligase
LYINGENETAKNHAPAHSILYSRSGAGDWKVERAQTGLQGTSFTLQSGSESISVRSHLLGLHQVGPLCATAHIASKFGFTAEQIEKGIDATKPFEHRLEPHTDAQGVVTLDDSYNGNPDGVRAIIEFLSGLQGGRRWYVTPGLVEMGPKKEEIHKEIGRQLARAGIEKVVLIRNSVTPFIFEGLQEEKSRLVGGQDQGEVLWFEKALEAFSALPNLTVKGDIVLLQNDWPDQYA